MAVQVGKIYAITERLRQECGAIGNSERSTHIKITRVADGGRLYYEILDRGQEVVGTCDGCIWGRHLTEQLTNTQNMNLLEKAKLAVKGEPDKSFIKAGVMTMEGDLTPEGTQLFLNYLLAKHGADFKKDVVDPISAEEKDAK